MRAWLFRAVLPVVILAVGFVAWSIWRPVYNNLTAARTQMGFIDAGEALEAALQQVSSGETKRTGSWRTRPDPIKEQS